MKDLLRNENTIVRKNLMVKIERILNGIIKSWLHKNYIIKQTYFLLFSSDSGLLKAYDLSKIHKANFPLRIIVSLTPLSINCQNFYIRSSMTVWSITIDTLKIALSNTKINNKDVIISLDAILTLDAIYQHSPWFWSTKHHKKMGAYWKKHMLPIRWVYIDHFILTSTYFTFNNIYRQTFGTPMDSPLSPIIADIVLQDLKEKALNVIGLDLSFYHRYMDDVVLAVPSEHTPHILNTFNSIHDRLKFTIEYEKNRLSFLDLLLRIVDDRIITDWYHKNFFSGRCLSYFSSHPSCYKLERFTVC